MILKNTAAATIFGIDDSSEELFDSLNLVEMPLLVLWIYLIVDILTALSVPTTVKIAAITQTCISVWIVSNYKMNLLAIFTQTFARSSEPMWALLKNVKL